MSPEEEVVFTIKGMIASLPAAQHEACIELAEHTRRQLASAGEPIGSLVIALLGAELQVTAAKAGH